MIEIGKTYYTKNGRKVIIDSQNSLGEFLGTVYIPRPSGKSFKKIRTGWKSNGECFWPLKLNWQLIFTEK